MLKLLFKPYFNRVDAIGLMISAAFITVNKVGYGLAAMLIIGIIGIFGERCYNDKTQEKKEREDKWAGF